MNENQKFIYDQLIGKGIEVGTPEEFANGIKSKEGAQWAYDQLSNDVDLGDFETYYKNVGQPEYDNKYKNIFANESQPTGSKSYIAPALQEADSKIQDAKAMTPAETNQVLNQGVPGVTRIGDTNINHLQTDMLMNVVS